jgi:hypothetical protein
VCGAFVAVEARIVVRKVCRNGSTGGGDSSTPVKRLKLGWFALLKAIVGVFVLCSLFFVDLLQRDKEGEAGSTL